jgi:hypothetical protein
MKLASSIVAASALPFAQAVYSPPAPEQGQELMNLWVSIANEAKFMQQEIALGRSESQCKADCNTEKEASNGNFNRGRCQKNCGQIADNGNDRSGSSGCGTFKNGGRRSDRCKDADDAGRKKNGQRSRNDDDRRDDDRRSNRGRGDNLFYKGMCGSDGDDTNFANNFCDDIGPDLCRGSNGDIKNFCKWLDSNTVSFSNDAYEEGMCDGPDSDDRDFCRDIGDELCDRNNITREENSLCKWLKGNLGAKTSLRAAVKN